MEQVLIATLGETPVVVPGMINVLAAQGVRLDRVQILYPAEHGERSVARGCDLIAEHLAERLPELVVERSPLPFDDATTEVHTMTFLRTVTALLEADVQAGNRVWLSVAGGRKHLSALLAVTTCFFPCVAGVYHLHDTEESIAHKQFTVMELERMRPADRQRRLNPPAERFTLVHLPHQVLAQAEQVRAWIRDFGEFGAQPPPIPIAPTAESFYARLMAPTTTAKRLLNVRFTRSALNSYRALAADPTARDACEQVQELLDVLTDPTWLAVQARQYRVVGYRANGTPITHRVARRAGIDRRLFYYTIPDDPAIAQDVVVTRIPDTVPTVGIDVELDAWAIDADTEALESVEELPDRPLALIATLGESPMVISQICTLLQHAPGLKRRRVQGIWAIYPDEFEPAANGAERLAAACASRGIDVRLYPQPIADLDSNHAGVLVADALRAAIHDARTARPDSTPAIVLSGGRKGMSVLALAAAQAQGIRLAYHTTIRSPQREQEIEERYRKLRSRSVSEQAAHMFLDNADLNDYILIEVPVIIVAALD